MKYLSRFMPGRLDAVLLLALAMIGAGIHLQHGPALALQVVGGILLVLGLVMARGAGGGHGSV